jgi:multimeric flavodoxin WrbA
MSLEQAYNQIILERINSSPAPIQKKISDLKEYLNTKENILFLTTSNRRPGQDEERPKSTLFAYHLKDEFPSKNIRIIEVPDLNILPCVGNVSTKDGNSCGLKGALLEDKDKNPSGYHRCWVSYGNKDDELWKISKELFKSDCVVFFSSIRWGQTNAIYQKLIERLNWIENRHTTLSEANVVKDIDVGFIGLGHNWNGKVVVETQQQVLKFFGFKTPNQLFFNWQYTTDAYDESKEGYKQDPKVFEKVFKVEI